MKKIWKRIVVQSSRRTLIERVREKFSDKLLDLSSPGITDIMIFKEAAPKTFKIEDREDIDIKKKELPKKSWWNIAATIGRRQSFFQQFPKMYYQTLIFQMF